MGASVLEGPCGPFAPDAGLAPSVHPFPPAEAGRRPFSCKQGGRPRLGHEWRATFPLGGHGGRVAGHLRPSQGPRGPHASALSPVRPCPQRARLSPCFADGPVWGSGADPAPTREGLRRRRSVGPPRGPVPPSTSDVARASEEVRSALRPGDRGAPKGSPSVADGPSQVRRLVGLRPGRGGPVALRRGTAAGGPEPTPPIGSMRLEAKRLGPSLGRPEGRLADGRGSVSRFPAR